MSSVPATPSASGQNTGLIILISCVATIGGLLFGYDSGAVNGTQPGLKSAFALDDAGLGPPVAEVAFRQAENLRQISIGKALLLGEFQQIERQFPALVAQDFLFARYQFPHLFQEPAVDGGAAVQFLHRRPLAQGFIEHELPFAGRRRQPQCWTFA